MSEILRPAYREFKVWAETTDIDATMRGAFTAGFAAGIAEAHKQTPLQAAALAALVAWRKAQKEYQQCSRDPRGIGLTSGLSALVEAEFALETVADHLIAEQEATS